jgi:hypothetical protein
LWPGPGAGISMAGLVEVLGAVSKNKSLDFLH